MHSIVENNSYSFQQQCPSPFKHPVTWRLWKTKKKKTKQHQTKSLLPIRSNSQWVTEETDSTDCNLASWTQKSDVTSTKLSHITGMFLVFSLWFILNMQFQHDSETVKTVSCFICQIWTTAITSQVMLAAHCSTVTETEAQSRCSAAVSHPSGTFRHFRK